MNCPTCSGPMVVVGGFWFCGEHDPPAFCPVSREVTGGASGDWLDLVVDAYPYPIACSYRALRDDVVAHPDEPSAFGQLLRVKDCVETLVKYLAVVALSARLDRGDPPDELDRRILQGLVQPSLGTWSQTILDGLVRAQATQDDARLAPLVAYADRGFADAVAEFTTWRNRVLGHGLKRHSAEDRADVNRWLPWLNDLPSAPTS